MSEELFVIPSPRDEYVELARTPSGKLFRKQILKDGQRFVHPKDPSVIIEVTPELQSKMTSNFHEGVCDIVQFPACGPDNKHSEGVLDNLGEVIDVEYEPGKGTYATIDARKHADDVGQTILGASAFFSLDYRDNETGKRRGPTLVHVAATNHPYLKDLEPYQEVVAASNSSEDVIILADETSTDTSVERDPLDEETAMPELDELLAALKDEHGIDVEDLQAKAAELDTAKAALSSGDVSLSTTDGTQITSVDLAEALVEVAHTVKSQGEKIVALSSTNDDLLQQRAEAEVDGYVEVGRILPKQRDRMVKLALSDRDAFNDLLPVDAVVELSERGVTVHDEPDKVKAREETVSHYIELAETGVNGKSRSKSR